MDINKNYTQYAEMLKIFANPVRLCILDGLLQKGECNVNHMEKCLGVSQSSVSQHLYKLKTAGLIKCEKIKNEVFYSITDDKVKNIIISILNGGKEI